MTEHFWMRRNELLGGKTKKPPCDARWVVDLHQARVAADDLRAAERRAARRLTDAMARWAA